MYSNAKPLEIDRRTLRVYPNGMQQVPDAINPPVYSVSDLNAYIRALLESNENLMDIWVAGEISNLSTPASGHVYFTLKDPGASLRCVIWRDSARRLKGVLRDGMAAEAHGYVSVYEQSGQYQLYVDGLRAAGEGLLYQEFLRLKAELEAEGLFEETRKHPIPTLPRTIGVVTSATGAAFQDMLNTLRARYPLAEVVLAPASVQGDAAPPQIVAALEVLNRIVHPDVIIIGRGGGSLEDLWAFNDERVVRAVVASSAPVISGVGHETDFTLTDFAADVRAPTPTGAAVTAAPDIADLAAELQSRNMRLTQSIKDVLEEKYSGTADFSNRMERVSPTWRIRQNMQRLDEIHQRMDLAVKHRLRAEIAGMKALKSSLLSLDPKWVLRRGYALVRNKKGALVTSVEQVQLGQIVDVNLPDGILESEVKKIEEINEGIE